MKTGTTLSQVCLPFCSAFIFFKGICLHAVAFSWSKDAEIVKSTELFTLSRYNRRNKANLLSAVSLDVAQCITTHCEQVFLDVDTANCCLSVRKNGTLGMNSFLLFKTC